MPILNKGTDFSNNDQVTSAKLDNLVDAADFTNTSGTAVDSSGTTGTCVSDGGLEVTDPGGQLQIASNGVTTAKILDANVTKAKIENVANMKVLGNTSGSAAAPQEVSILDEDDMSSDSATALATQQSIKAYINSVTGLPSVYRTVDAQVSGQLFTFGNWTELTDPGGLGAFGTGSSGIDQPYIYNFASTGTYLIEASMFIEDNASGQNFSPSLYTTDGTTASRLTYTTNTGGLGGLLPIVTQATNVATGFSASYQLNFVYKVGDTSTSTLYINAAEGGGAYNDWDAAATLKITKLSDSLI